VAKRKILIVDDEKDIVDVLAKKLSAEDYDVLRALTVREAMDITRKIRPDLILMDIVLPDMEGPEAVRRLAEDPLTQDIPVLFLSGIISRDEEFAQPEINVGGRLYKAISKPFVFEILFEEIRKILE
jgi:CheY-like chemotaxis protein